MELVKLKFERGANFGVFHSDEERFITPVDTVCAYDFSRSLFSVFAREDDFQSCVIGPAGTVRADELHRAHFLPCATATEVSILWSS